MSLSGRICRCICLQRLCIGVGAFLCTVSRLDAAIAANVHVQADSIRATMSSLGLGLHTSPYYNYMSHANVDDRLEEAGVTTLRFGGGGYADVFHWSIGRAQWLSGVTGGGTSPFFGEAGNYGYVGEGSDFASFVRLLDRTENAQAVVTVNHGSALKLSGNQSLVPDYAGQPQEAAAWVAYANANPAIYGTASDVPIGVDQQGNDWKTAGYWAKLRASTPQEYQSWAQASGEYDPLNAFLAIDRDAAVGIQYWEIGNETFGTGYYDNGEYSVNYSVPYDGTPRSLNANLSPAKYGQDVAAFSQLMKAIDPTIKIGAVLATPPDDYGWSYADLNNNNVKNANEPYWNDEVLTHAADDVDFVMVHWYPWAGENANGNSLLAQVGQKIPLMINGATAGQDAGASAGLRDTLAAFGIPNAEIMITEFNYFGSLQPVVADSTESLFVADAYATWLEQGVHSVQYLEMLTKDFLSDDAALTRDSAFYGVSMVNKLVGPGESLLEAESSRSDVRVHAARQDDGSLAVMILNLNRTESADVSVVVDGIALNATGTRIALQGGTSLTESTVANLGNQFTANVPARSIVLYHVLALDNLAGDFDLDGTVDGNDFLLWQRGLASQSPSASDLADWQANYGGGMLITATMEVPEPSTFGSSVVCLFAAAACRMACRRSERRRE